MNKMFTNEERSNLTYETIYKNILEKFDHPPYDHEAIKKICPLAKDKLWLLGVNIDDARRCNYDINQYEKFKKEPGTAKALNAAICFILSIPVAKQEEWLSPDFIKKLHHLATRYVKAKFIEGEAYITKDEPALFVGGSFYLDTKYTTVEGLEKIKEYEFLQRETPSQKPKKMAWLHDEKNTAEKLHKSKKKYLMASKYFHTEPVLDYPASWNKVVDSWHTKHAEAFIKEYITSITNADNDKLCAIATFMQKFFLDHPLPQGNFRTARLMFQVLLRANNLSLTLIDKWHYIAGCHPQHIADKVKIGQKEYENLCSPCPNTQNNRRKPSPKGKGNSIYTFFKNLACGSCCCKRPLENFLKLKI